MNIKEARKQINVTVKRYEREWELFSYNHKGFIYNSEEWKVLKTSNSREIKQFMSRVIDRLVKLEDKMYEEQQKSIKERENIITGIEVIKECLRNMNVEAEKTIYNNYSNKELMDILDSVCKIRNQLINSH